MKREMTCYETNNLDTLKFIRWCKIFHKLYNHKKLQTKLMFLPDIAELIWRMIQEDMFSVNYWGIVDFSKIINDIGYVDFMKVMYNLCDTVIQNEKEYIYNRNFKGEDNISLIGEPIYKFMNRIEELIPYED